jgi:two-component system, NtrC family, sensor kinase
MKRNCIFLLLVLFINESFSQTKEIDSLKHVLLKSSQDTQRINLLNKIGYSLSEVNLDSSTLLLKNNLANAQRINYKKGEGGALINLGGNYSRQGNYPAALEALKSAAVIVMPTNDSLQISRIYATYGMINGMQGKYDSSIFYYQKSVGIEERAEDILNLASNYGNLAIGYQMQSNFSQALVYQLKSLKIAERLNNLKSQAYTLMNIGNTYQDIGDTLRAEQSILKGIDLAKKIGIKNVELYGYSNISDLYSELKKWKLAYDYAMRSADLAEKMGDAGIEAAGLCKAGMALAHEQRFDEAQSLSKKAITIADSSRQPFNIFQAYAGMGTVLKLAGKCSEAIPFFQKSIQLLSASDRYDQLTQSTYASLAECFESTGDYEKALSNFKVAAQLQDSIRSKENIKKTTELTLNSDFERKQALSDEIQGRKNAESRLKQILLLGGLIITLVVAAAAWRTVRNKQKANRLLESQKEEIQNTLVQLKATQAQLIQSEKMASLGELTAGIAHEIQNPLNFVNNFSEINIELVAELNTELNQGNIDEARSIAKNIQENEKKINHHGKRADSIVKGMLLHSRASSGQKEPTNINALTDEYLRLTYHGLRAKDKSFNATLKTDFDDNIGKINVVPQDIGRVLLNLCTNAFYSVNEKKKQHPEGYEPLVSITTKKVGQIVELTVTDNGNGIPQSVLDKIFQPFFTTKPSGEGTGLGLSLSYDIIKAHGGELKVETEEGTGTSFIITLPV